MRKRLLAAVISAGLLFGTAPPSFALVRHRTHYRTTAQYARHRQHMRTAKRVGIGAAGGAAVGAIAGGGKGAGIGALAGAGAGALYDRHKRHKARRYY
jgi:outer membrane lipoprotein SlyB